MSRSLEEAIEIANDEKKLIDNSRTSRATKPREIDLTNGIEFITTGTSRSNTDTLIYVINYKDNAGFALISARRSTNALLALVESGSYSSAKALDNPGFNSFINNAIEYVAGAPTTLSAPGEDIYEIQEFRREEIIMANDTVLPRTKVLWDQVGLYGKYCVNKYAGCSNTAAAIAMSYFKHPSTLTLKHDNNRTITLDWDAMTKHISNPWNYYCCTASTHESIGRIMRELGYRSNSTYEEKSTPTPTINTRKTLIDLGYTASSMYNYKSQCVRHRLGDGIIMMWGTDENDGAHMWVVDGYIYIKKQVIEYVRYIGSQNWIEIHNIITEDMQNHFNLGWGDSNFNGYYCDNVFNIKNSNCDFKKNVQYFVLRK